MIGLFLFLLIMPFIPSMENEISWQAYSFLAPISIAMIALMSFGLSETIKGKFVIDSGKVYSVGTFSNRELIFDEIKGYRINDKYIFIESNTEGKKKIKVSNYFGKTGEIKEWLSERYPDLDMLNETQEREDILNNDSFGLSTEQRLEKLTQATKVAKILNWSGGIIAAWTLFLPKPYDYAIIVSIGWLLVCVAVLKYFGGLIKVNEKKGTAYPSIFIAIVSIGFGLSLRGLRDFNVFDYSNLWLPVSAITIAIVTFIIAGNKEFKLNTAEEYFSVLVISLLIFGYSYGAVVILNCMYDKSTPEIFTAKILDKRISSGRSTTYYLKLTPWGRQKEIDDVAVSKELYRNHAVNEEVEIYFFKGLFDIPWFNVPR